VVQVIRLAALAAALAAAFAAQAELYRWTDSAGRVHVTDTPPPPGARTVQKSEGGAAKGGPREPFELERARKESPVTLYSTASCDPCNDARAALNARGVPFAEKSIVTSDDLAQLKKMAGTDAVPVITVGATVVKGFEQASLNGALDAAGYPRAGLLPARNQQAPQPPAPKAEAPAAPPAEPEQEIRGPYAPRPPKPAAAGK